MLRKIVRKLSHIDQNRPHRLQLGALKKNTNVEMEKLEDLNPPESIIADEYTRKFQN